VTDSLVFLVAAAGAYVAAHLAFDWLARRYLVVSAAEYLVLGILLGPQVLGALSPSLLNGLTPVVTLALGWIGATVGTEFRLTRLVATPARSFRIAFAESALTFVTVAALEFVVLSWTSAASDSLVLVPALVLGAMATSSSSAGIGIVAEVLGRRGAVVRQLQLSTQINAFVAVSIYGLLLAVHHAAIPASRPLTPTEWAVISIALGVVGGALFHIFLGDTPDPDRLFVSLVGAIVLVSGAASYLRLSPILSALFFGIILANTTTRPEVLVTAMSRVERPFYFVLLLLGGAMWHPSVRAWVLPVALFILARALAKVAASRLAARANGALPQLGPHWGRALLGQGRLTLAIGVSYLRQPDTPFNDLVFTAAVASILLTEFFSARLVRSVLPGQGDDAEQETPDEIASGEPLAMER
jgi:Kef-type K+ transport system membrane component KefB